MLRLVTWNCCVGDFRNKSRHVATLRADVLAVQEVERIEHHLLFGGEQQPTFVDRLENPESRRSIGVLSYSDISLRPVDTENASHGFRRFEAYRGDGLRFNVAAVWTSATKTSATSYRQAHDGIDQWQSWIASRPTVMLGDFNQSQAYRPRPWKELLERLERNSLVSAYHAFFGEAFGEETLPTHYHLGKEQDGWHIDYCFVPVEWRRCIKDVRVGSYGDWHAVSDHVPLIVDVEV